MAKRLIDAEKLKQRIIAFTTGLHADYLTINNIVMMINQADTVDAVELPCKIGDYVWAIRNYHGHKHPQRGVVSDMYFTRDMQLHIVVKHVARGKWGETVFATDADAYAVINGGQALQREEG